MATAKRLETIRAAEQYPSALQVASVYSVLGCNDDAFRLLQAGFEEGDGSVLLVTVYPQFDGIRSDRRYQSLLAKFSLA